MPTASNASSSWETPLVFYEAEEIVPGSMADNEAQDRHKSLVRKFGQEDVDKAKPEGLNPEGDEEVVPVNGCGRGEAGRRPVAIGQQPMQAYQQSAGQSAHQAAYHQGQMAATYDQYYGATADYCYMNHAQFEMMQQAQAYEAQQACAMQTWNAGGQQAPPRGQAAGSGGSKPPGSKPPKNHRL